MFSLEFTLFFPGKSLTRFLSDDLQGMRTGVPPACLAESQEKRCNVF